jgi:hypothetical protein
LKSNRGGAAVVLAASNCHFQKLILLAQIPFREYQIRESKITR